MHVHAARTVRGGDLHVQAVGQVRMRVVCFTTSVVVPCDRGAFAWRWWCHWWWGLGWGWANTD